MTNPTIGAGHVPPGFTPQPLLSDQLASVILESISGFTGELTDTTSLIRSGLLDSLGLINTALFIEREIGHPVDLSAVDLELEWDTIADIQRFIENLRRSI